MSAKLSSGQQYGGVKVAMMTKDGKMIPTCDQMAIVREVFDRRLRELYVVNVKSSASVVLGGTLSNVMLRNQRGLRQADAVDCLQNVALGDPVVSVVFKISIVDERRKNLDPIDGKSKVTVTSDEADREVEMQKTLYQDLSCVNTKGAFIPDVVAHVSMEPGEFTAMIKSLKKRIKTPGLMQLFTNYETDVAFDWIDDQLEEDAGRKVDIIIMELAPGQTVASLSDWRDGSLGTAAAAVVTAVKGHAVLPFDLHPGNTMMQRFYPANPFSKMNPIPTLIDFGRWWRLPRDENKLKRIFQKLQHDKLNVASSPITMGNLCHFFGCDVAELEKRFQYELDFLKTGNDACCSKLQGPNALKNTHRTLMMIAFIDFMTNRCEYDFTKCQFRYSMTHVYVFADNGANPPRVIDAYSQPLMKPSGKHPTEPPSGNPFAEFSEFLQRCTPDYDRFFAENFPDKYNSDKAIVLRNLQRVDGLIKDMIAPCPFSHESSVITCGRSFRYDPMAPPPVAAETLFPIEEEMEVDASPILPIAAIASAMEVDASPILPIVEEMEVDASLIPRAALQVMDFVPPPPPSRRNAPKSQPPKSQPPKSQPPPKPQSHPELTQISRIAKPPVKPREIPVPKTQPITITTKPAPVAPVCEKDKKGKRSCSILGGTRNRSTLKRRSITVKRSTLKRSTLKCTSLRRNGRTTRKNKY